MKAYDEFLIVSEEVEAIQNCLEEARRKYEITKEEQHIRYIQFYEKILKMRRKQLATLQTAYNLDMSCKLAIMDYTLGN